MRKSFNSTTQDIHLEKDKHLVPFLLTMEEEGVQFLGTETQGPTVLFKFSPAKKCQNLVDQFYTNKAPKVSAKNLLRSLEQFRDIIYRHKDEMNHGGDYGRFNKK